MADFGVRFGVILKDIERLKLKRGQRVCLEPADDIPIRDAWYARPADGKWYGRMDHDAKETIVLLKTDFMLEQEG